MAQALPNDSQTICDVFAEICAIPLPDGVIFDTAGITAETIVEDVDYPGARVRIPSSLDGTRDIIQVDVGFGDIVTASPRVVDFPIQLDDMSAPRIQTYPIETVVAEKFEAMISLGPVNTRLKDFFDVYQRARIDDFDGTTLRQAVPRAFHHRGTQFEARPVVFDDAFATDPERRRNWTALLRRIGLNTAPIEFATVIATIRALFLPIYMACLREEAFAGCWSPQTQSWSEGNLQVDGNGCH